MTLGSRLRASFFPPEPVRVLSLHVLRAASELHSLPRWLERYPLGAMSPSARQVSWAAARRITGNPDHGFAMAARVPADAVGWLWALNEAAPSLAALHERYREFSALLLDDMDCTIERAHGSVRLRHHAPASGTVDRAAQDFRRSALRGCADAFGEIAENAL
ncbi:MAG: hypothetical protein RLZZ450_7683 [Pseudomonadota bacterium]|jgi:hypothetical protein